MKTIKITIAVTCLFLVQTNIWTMDAGSPPPFSTASSTPGAAATVSPPTPATASSFESDLITAILVFSEEPGELDHIKSLINERSVYNTATDGNTPLHAAVSAMLRIGDSATPILRTLISYNAPIDKLYEGLTPLLSAAKYCALNAIPLLIEKGANINALDPENNTVLHLLASAGNNCRGRNFEKLKSIIDLLKEKGFDISKANQKNKQGEDFYDLAIQNNNNRLIYALIKDIPTKTWRQWFSKLYYSIYQ